MSTKIVQNVVSAIREARHPDARPHHARGLACVWVRDDATGKVRCQWAPAR